MTADLDYLTGYSRLATRRPGFEGHPEGTEMQLKVWKETRERASTTARGRPLISRQPRMVIELAAPDGIRHRFHTDPESASTASSAARQPAGHIATPVRHHSIDTFVRFFHLPAPSGITSPQDADHALLDLLEAIVAAASASA